MEAEDIGKTPNAIALQQAIAAAPHDQMPQLVLADFLQDAGDPRGELIALDLFERTTPGGIADLEALLRYLLLAAEYSFPRALPDDPPLVFHGYGLRSPRFTAEHAGERYTVAFHNRHLTVTCRVPRLSCALERTQDANWWTSEETAVILRLIGDAILAGTHLGSLRFPLMRESLPVYDGGPLRGYRLPKSFLKRFGLPKDRYGLAPRDLERWTTTWNRLSMLGRGVHLRL